MIIFSRKNIFLLFESNSLKITGVLVFDSIHEYVLTLAYIKHQMCRQLRTNRSSVWIPVSELISGMVSKLD